MASLTSGLEVLGALSRQMADAVARVAPTVVQVNGRPRRPASGTVYAEGLVVAADHALERDEGLTVETDAGPALPAEIAGRDPATDLALLRVAGLARPAAAPASDPARVGAFVLAVARPGGGELMASIGVVSALGGPVRTAGGLLEQYIRTDATPYPGFSGGALVDAAGGVLGVVTTGLAGGAGLAIPIALAWRVADALAREGHVRRGYLGLASQPVRIPEAQRADVPRERGLLVVEVAPDSPAARAGVLVGDIVIGLAGRPVSHADELQALLVGDSVGATLALDVLRGGGRATVAVTVGSRGAGPSGGPR